MSEAQTAASGPLNLGALAQVVARNLDDIVDLPDYKTPFPGVYKLIISKIAQEERNDKTCLVIYYQVAEVVSYNEAPDPENDKEQICVPGDMFTEAFYFDKPENIETTLGALKKKFAGLAQVAGSSNLLDILNKMPGMQVQCIIANRTSKKDGKIAIFPNTKDMVPAV